MAKGGRTNFKDLMGATGANSSVDGARASSASPERTSLEIPLADVVANPRNPRQHNMNVDDLESIKEMQLQPAVGVSRAAYLKLWPEDESTLGAAKYVVVMGNRRLLACETYGKPVLDTVIKDEIAASRSTFRAAALRENVERENLDVIEEARAVEELVKDAGSAVDAAAELKKTTAWVSQRRALLKLAPDLQEKLRGGELAIRDARKLAQVPMEQQVARWQKQLHKQPKQTDNQSEETSQSPTVAPSVKSITKALKRWDADTGLLAAALFSHLKEEGVGELIDQLQTLAATSE